MGRKTRTIAVLRRIRSHLFVGLMYCGTHAWPTAELIAAVRTASAEATARAARPPRRGEPPAASPERITPIGELPDSERALLLELERRLRREKEE